MVLSLWSTLTNAERAASRGRFMEWAQRKPGLPIGHHGHL